MEQINQELTSKLQAITDLQQRIRNLESIWDGLRRIDHDLADIGRRVEKLEIEASRGNLAFHG